MEIFPCFIVHGFTWLYCIVNKLYRIFLTARICWLNFYIPWHNLTTFNLRLFFSVEDFFRNDTML